MRFIHVCAAVVLAACGQPEQAPRAPQTPRTETAVSAVRAGLFADALREADAALTASPRDAQAAAVRALARYQRAGETLIRELGQVIETGENLKALDHEKGRQVWRTFLADLDQVDADLAIVAADSQFALELCLACWKYDWNRNGQIDERDGKMFELEFDGKGGELAERDPRRRPTIRFDVGDALWARAMIAFQRAGVQLVLGYRWSELDKLFGGDADVITIKLIDGARVQRARELVLVGLGFAAQTREAYLAETDDDREWVPSPRQKSYAMPLEVDDRLYATWAYVIGDVHRMLSSQEGVNLREAAALVVGASDAERVPDAYVDLGRMFREPTDVIIDFRSQTSVETMVRGILGNGYAKKLGASPLVGRLRHMKSELERGEDSLERKLRYLLWFN